MSDGTVHDVTGAASFEQIDTPALLFDLDVVERNIEEMAAVARHAGVGLRPHAKTHKSPEIAGMQIAAGARGLTVAKLDEAEIMIDAGVPTCSSPIRSSARSSSTGWRRWWIVRPSA